jgi:NAD(P)-dependent dehydrogenase (short-subunit alcohol dehydrogenase family)
VTVNSVLPGPTMSDGVKTFVDQLGANMKKSNEEMKELFFKESRPSSLIGRFADPKEVAHMVVYIASALSSSTNGAALRVDGGVVKSIN